MRIEVDSSGVWGNQAQPSVFAFSDSKTSAIWISPDVKRACITELRGKKRLDVRDYVRLYAISVFLLVRDHLGAISELILDEEYPKKMGMVRHMLLELMKAVDSGSARIPIKIRRIGKTSRAHEKANAVFRGEQSADRRVQAKEILDLF